MEEDGVKTFEALLTVLDKRDQRKQGVRHY